MGEAATPTVSQISSWQLGTLDTQATTWKQQSVTLKTELDGISTNVGNSVDYLVGKFGNGLRDKGVVVRDDGYKTVGALEAAGTAIAVGSPGMRFAQQTVKHTLATLTAEGYLHGEDGTVTLSLAQTANALSDKDNSNAAVKLAALQRQADLYSTTLKGALHAGGVAAQGVSDGVSKAFEELPKAAQGAKPGSLTDPGAAKQQGTDDGKLVAGGKATDEQLQAISARLAAAGITTDDVQAINAGKQVQLSETQWNYLHEFYNTAGVNGLTSMTDRLSGIHDTNAAATVANQLNTLANPKVHSAGTETVQGKQSHPQGGLNQLPADLQTVLTKEYEVRPGRPYNNLNAYGLSQVTKMMGFADSRSAPGSDINKQLLLQATNIAPQANYGVNVDTDYRHGSGEGLLQGLVDVGGRDKIAVHDLLTNTGVPAGTADTAMTNLLHHHWANDGAGVQKMLSWVQSDATYLDPTNTDNPIASRAGQTASTLAEYVATHKDALLNMDGGSLGAVNPLAAQGIGSALSPYIADLAGVDHKYVNTHDFTAPKGDLHTPDRDGARAIFTVIDSDKNAAVAFNTKALEVSEQLQSTWVHSLLADPANPDWGLATKSGTIMGLVDQGLAGETDARKATEIRAAIKDFAQDGANWDTGKGILTTGLKNIPFINPIIKDVFAPVIDVSNSYAKMNMVGFAYTAPDPAQTNLDTSHEYAPARAFYQVAQVLQNGDGFLPHDPQYSELFTDGKLKSYDEAVNTSGDPTQLEGKLENILNAYRGGALKADLQSLKLHILEGRLAVK
ncbi:hypothetical protein [Nocardia sp. NPDC056000]|uniref:TPR repeat region-containing protein n=1 Tax=Nocardia sp. NPDC056000 TaxID=3345674 RepID=UPI0035E138BD